MSHCETSQRDFTIRVPPWVSIKADFMDEDRMDAILRCLGGQFKLTNTYKLSVTCIFHIKYTYLKSVYRKLTMLIAFAGTQISGGPLKTCPLS